MNFIDLSNGGHPIVSGQTDPGLLYHISTGITPGVTHEPLSGGSKRLSPDQILEYVQLRLDMIDDQMGDHKAEVDARKQRQDDIRAFASIVREMNQGAGYDTQGMPKDAQRAEDTLFRAKLTDVISKISASSPDLKAKLEDMKARIDIDKGSKITAETLNAYLDDAKDELSKLNSDNEMTMMRLSSLMQQRTQITQFASNVMASLNEAMKSVIQNMRG